MIVEILGGVQELCHWHLSLLPEQTLSLETTQVLSFISLVVASIKSESPTLTFPLDSGSADQSSTIIQPQASTPPPHHCHPLLPPRPSLYHIPYLQQQNPMPPLITLLQSLCRHVRRVTQSFSYQLLADALLHPCRDKPATSMHS